jgi:hypothetical protein
MAVSFVHGRGIALRGPPPAFQRAEGMSTRVGFPNLHCAESLDLRRNYQRRADWEIGDTADSEICATMKRPAVGIAAEILNWLDAAGTQMLS